MTSILLFFTRTIALLILGLCSKLCNRVPATSLLSSSIILCIFTPCRSTSTNCPSPCLIEPLHPAGLLTRLSRQGQMDQRRARPLERALQHSRIGASARGTPNQHATSPSSFPQTHSSAQFYPPPPPSPQPPLTYLPPLTRFNAP